MRPGQGRPADATPLLAGAAAVLEAALGPAGNAPASEARFYEALAGAGYGATSEADVRAADAALMQVSLTIPTPLTRLKSGSAGSTPASVARCYEALAAAGYAAASEANVQTADATLMAASSRTLHGVAVMGKV